MKDGTYTENINVTKELIIRSENSYTATTVIAADYHYGVFKITANNVTIDGFTIYGTTYRWNYDGAIELIGVNNCTITNNCCGLDYTHNNLMGVILNSNSDNNTISNNILSYTGWYGIQIAGGSDNNLILNNEISFNNSHNANWHASGIINDESSLSNKVRGNIIENNEDYGVRNDNSNINLGNNDINDKGNNTIKNNGLYDVTNGSVPINAYYNNWGTNDTAIIDQHILDNEEGRSEVFFDPFNPAVVNTFYVSTTGNDSNDGSEANPWLTIQGAIDNSSVNNGDTIIVKDGTYNENINVTKEITIQSESGYLNTTVISTSTTQSVFEVSASNVTIDGFTAYGTIDYGIMIPLPSTL